MQSLDLDKPVTVSWSEGTKPFDREFATLREAVAFFVETLSPHQRATGQIEGSGMKITNPQAAAELHRTGELKINRP